MALAIDANSNALWKHIEAHLDQPSGDTARYFILERVRQHCGKDFECLYASYYAVRWKLERRFNLPLAISIADEMVKTFARNGDLKKEASSHRNLSRYHGAMSDDQQTIAHLDRALRLYEQTCK